MPSRRELRQKAFITSDKRFKTRTPFNDYMKAQDMELWRKLLTKITDEGVSNCTLCASNAYGDKYTFGSAYNLIRSGKFKEIPSNKVKKGDMMIQSLPGVKDGYDNKYHTATFMGVADKDFINPMGEKFFKGDTIYNYSRGKGDVGQFVQKSQRALKNNNGKTNFRFFTPIESEENKNKLYFWNL